MKAWREGWTGRGGEREGCEGWARGMDGKGWLEGRVLRLGERGGREGVARGKAWGDRRSRDGTREGSSSQFKEHLPHRGGKSKAMCPLSTVYALTTCYCRCLQGYEG